MTFSIAVEYHILFFQIVIYTRDYAVNLFVTPVFMLKFSSNVKVLSNKFILGL